jgi:hypothetical protein
MVNILIVDFIFLLAHNDQIWRVAIPFLESRKIVKLPNHHNSIHEELRSESLNPERRK